MLYREIIQCKRCSNHLAVRVTIRTDRSCAVAWRRCGRWLTWMQRLKVTTDENFTLCRRGREAKGSKEGAIRRINSTALQQVANGRDSKTTACTHIVKTHRMCSIKIVCQTELKTTLTTLKNMTNMHPQHTVRCLIWLPAQQRSVIQFTPDRNEKARIADVSVTECSNLNLTCTGKLREHFLTRSKFGWISSTIADTVKGLSAFMRESRVQTTKYWSKQKCSEQKLRRKVTHLSWPVHFTCKYYSFQDVATKAGERGTMTCGLYACIYRCDVPCGRREV